MDRARFLELATAELRAVYGFARRLVGDPHRADDLVQDVYAQALRPERIEAFEPRGGGVRSWLLRITYRMHLSRTARARRESTLLSDLGDADPAAPEAVAAARARDFDWDGVDARLEAAVARLDEGARDVLLLWAIDGLQYREIASVLDVPVGTVMSRLHRARTKVSNSLLSDEDAAEDLGLRPQGPPVTETAHRRTEP